MSAKKDLEIVVLAAGNGTRFPGNERKVMLPLGGLPILHHVIRTARSLEPSKIIVVTDDDINVPDVQLVFQNAKLGTADAVKCAIPYLESKNVLILYGDTPLLTNETISKVYSLVESGKSQVSVLGFKPNNIDHQYGTFDIESEFPNTVSKIVEYSPALKSRELANSGIIAANKSLLSELINEIEEDGGEYKLTEIVRLVNEKTENRAHYIICDESEALGVNNRSDLVNAEKCFQNRVRREMLNNRVTLIDPCTNYFSFDTRIEQDCIIYPNVVFGPGVSIGAGSTIFSFSSLSGTKIGERCNVGPFANLRGSSILSNDVLLGSFVDIKNSFIGLSSKIKHLSYIGDSYVGKNVNIGACVVTCNYDGICKNKTSIGDFSFIGSNSCLIAPLYLGAYTKIGAGSVITENVPYNSLSFSRSDQITHKKSEDML